MDDWPLLVLCPSSARYHWEMELRHWMGSESRKLEGGCAIKEEGGGGEGDEGSRPVDGGEEEDGEGEKEAASKGEGEENMTILRNDQINVMTSGKGKILKRDGSTRVVICSISLVVNLIESDRLRPGMLKAVIVDESHSLKSRSTKRTRYVVPLLRAAERVLLLSGTPALARPAELWPQLSVLGSRRGEDGADAPGSPSGDGGGDGVWCDEDEFYEKYGKGKREETIRSGRLAELHTMLTSTVMIRRMKSDILKNLPAKVREKAYVKVKDEDLRNEFRCVPSMRMPRSYFRALTFGFSVMIISKDVHAAAQTGKGHPRKDGQGTAQSQSDEPQRQCGLRCVDGRPPPGHAAWREWRGQEQGGAEPPVQTDGQVEDRVRH